VVGQHAPFVNYRAPWQGNVMDNALLVHSLAVFNTGNSGHSSGRPEKNSVSPEEISDNIS
jgi:hypothetical protein